MTIIKEKRLELLGILIVTVSLLTLLSFFGHDPNEDPGISPNVKVENPMGILGVWISYLFIKLGFGYSSFILPILSGVWGVWFFMHKDFKFLGVVLESYQNSISAYQNLIEHFSLHPYGSCMYVDMSYLLKNQ